MLNLSEIRRLSASVLDFCAVASMALTLAACGTFLAGGVDEETNTVAGASEDSSRVEAPVDTSRYPDTVSDSSSNKEYVVVVVPPVKVVDGEISGSFTMFRTFYGRLLHDGSESLLLKVYTSNGVLETETDPYGNFVLERLPTGTYTMLAASKSGQTAAYLINNSIDRAELLGPVPAQALDSLGLSDLRYRALQNFEYGLAGSLDPSPGVPTVVDSSVNNGEANEDVSYEPPKCGSDGTITTIAENEFPKSADYGTICKWGPAIENGSLEPDSRGEPYTLEEWYVEVSFVLDSVDYGLPFRRNVFGKFSDAGEVFSLAIINGECGTDTPSYAFLVGRGSGFDCEWAVISTAPVETGKEISMTATFDGRVARLFKDGFEIAEKDFLYREPVDFSVSPFVLGDSELDLKLDDVRLGDKAIGQADVLYRYYQIGGEQ